MNNRTCIDCGRRCSRGSTRCHGCAMPLAHEKMRRTFAEVDEIAVERMTMGQPPAHTTRGERQEAVLILTGRGLNARQIAERIQVTDRTVRRLRARAAA